MPDPLPLAELTDGTFTAGGVLVVLAGLAALYFLGTPLLIMSQQRLNAKPKCVPFDPETNPPPETVRRLRERHVGELLEAGFEPFGDALVRGLVPNSDVFVAIFEHPDTGDTAAAVVTHVTNAGQTETKAVVEFNTLFEDGSLVETIANYDGTSLPPRSGVTRHVFLGVDDARELYRLHRAAVERESNGRRVVVPDHPDAAAWMADDVATGMRGPIDAGYLTPLGDRGKYQLTLKGAYLVTWSLLPPLKQIRAAAIRREAARKLADWGVTA